MPFFPFLSFSPSTAGVTKKIYVNNH